MIGAYLLLQGLEHIAYLNATLLCTLVVAKVLPFKNYTMKDHFWQLQLLAHRIPRPSPKPNSQV